jgi:hypothetical protein
MLSKHESMSSNLRTVKKKKKKKKKQRNQNILLSVVTKPAG